MYALQHYVIVVLNVQSQPSGSVEIAFVLCSTLQNVTLSGAFVGWGSAVPMASMLCSGWFSHDTCFFL